jgi:hypothetical protein
MVQSCRHILVNHQCGAPALRGQHFCRHHRDLHNWKRRSGLRSHITTPTQTYDHGTMLVPEPKVYPPLELEFPEDRASIQINIFRIIDYLARGLMDRSTATALMYGMQVAQTNLGKTPLLESVPASHSHSRTRSQSDDDDSETTYSDSSAPAAPVSRVVSRVILTPEGDEIAPPVEILEDNEAEPIHHRLCPCLLCAEKYRNQPPEEHHPDCQCGLCEDQEPTQEHVPLADLTSEDPDQQAEIDNGCHPERSEAESRDLLLPEPATTDGAPFKPDVGLSGTTLTPAHRKRVARAAALLSGSASRDPLNRPWSVAEYTFGDAVRRHEAQYAARAAAALAVGIEPPPYQPFITGLIRPGTPEWEEEQQMQQHSSEYWAEHFRKQIAERPDIQQYLDEEQAGADSGAESMSS